ncbi:MAG: D-glycero-beta-D-manno-heptose 1,7-bisphosphate 7-phosphatase [bacterium]
MPLVILDRDGVINKDSDHYIKSAEEWIPIPGSIAAIARMTQAGFRVVVATNQSGLSRGLFNIDDMHACHEKMNRLIAEAGGRIEAILFSPYINNDAACRKPNPGMLEQIGIRFRSSLKTVPVIGDSLRDLQAAVAVNARPILVLTGKGQKTLTQLSEIGGGMDGVTVFADLAAAADSLIQARAQEQKF